MAIRSSLLRSRALRWAGRGFLALALLYVLLLIPERDPEAVNAADRRPFQWNRDAFWDSLQARFEQARAGGCREVEARIDELVATIESLSRRVEAEPLSPEDPALTQLETSVFELAPLVAACPDRLEDYLRRVERLRQGVKRQSEGWDMSSPAARSALYRLLYGSRAAQEEVLLQAPENGAPALCLGTDEPSATPALEAHGIELHSGDILVSRGDVPVSALIARAHDLPGNFSHVALLHVDAQSARASVIEAHIESGVVVSTAEQYLKDRKLRILVLRPRADLPELAADPLLPHRAASQELSQARERHIPYDFAMDAQDHAAQFCSEVASAAYEGVGIHLWPGASSISAPGVAAWLAAFGVRHFETQEPSDLEYDPQLRVVAEWRDLEALFQDHVDNAVVDALLEDALAGKGLAYDRALLPLVRVLKAWSLLLNCFGRAGPVPEGMSATAALRNVRYVRDHEAVRERLLALAADFERQHGYRAPYWELVRLARQAKQTWISARP